MRSNNGGYIIYIYFINTFVYIYIYCVRQPTGLYKEIILSLFSMSKTYNIYSVTPSSI